MKQKIELYSAEALERRRVGNKIWTAITWAIAGAALTVCIVLTATINTANETRNELTVMILSAAAGCVVIFLGKNLVFEGRRELRHFAALSDEEPEAVSGTVNVVPGVFRIPGSVRVQTLMIRQADGTVQRASVNVRAVRQLKNRTEPLTLWLCHGFVVAWEG